MIKVIELVQFSHILLKFQGQTIFEQNAHKTSKEAHKCSKDFSPVLQNSDWHFHCSNSKFLTNFQFSL